MVMLVVNAQVAETSLFRRYFLVQQAKEAQVFGILMGTLGVNKYLDVVHGLQNLIKKSVPYCVHCRNEFKL